MLILYIYSKFHTTKYIIMSKTFTVKLPEGEGFDIKIEFVQVEAGGDSPIDLNEQVIQDAQGNLAWNGCGCN